MYRFLDPIPIGTIRELAATHVPGLADRLRHSPRDICYAVLFAIFGFDILSSQRVRRELIASLDASALSSLLSELRISESSSRFDDCLSAATGAWRSGSSLVCALKSRFPIPLEFLPTPVGGVATVESLTPYTAPPSLFDYQTELADRVFKILISASPPSFLLQLPTGAGKTRVMMEAIASALEWRRDQGMSVGVVWLAHAAELCEQAAQIFSTVWVSRGTFEHRLVRLWGDYRPAVDTLDDAFVVAGYQRLSSRSMLTLNLLDVLGRASWLVVADEAHRALAPTVVRLLQDLRARGGALLAGLTATPGRGSGVDRENRNLAALFSGELISSSQLGDNPIATLQSRGILARIRPTVIEGLPSVETRLATGEKLEDGDVSSAVLRRLSQNAHRNNVIVGAVREQVLAGRPTLVFCCSVDHAKHLSALTAAEGISCAFVHARMTTQQRRSAVRGFRAGSISALFNYGVLSTGFDAPNIDCVMIARPTTSIVLYSQMVGRGLRGPLVGGSREFRLIDVRDNLAGYGDLDAVYKHFSMYWE